MAGKHWRWGALAGAALAAGSAFAEDDAPKPVDTAGLAPLGAEWRKVNPYRGDAAALKIGAAGYKLDCARCHGAEAVSGGLAPDLRYLDKAEAGDEMFLNRIRHGFTLNGVVKMPAFEGVLSQEAMWAIRTYLDSRHVEE